MRVLPLFAFIGCLSAGMSSSSAVYGEVVDSEEAGFHLVFNTKVRAAPKVVWQNFQQLGTWWNSSHTWSGSSRNLSLDLVSGGGMNEKLPGGGFVRHLEVVYVDPEKMARLRGALGPLQEYALQGTLSVKLTAEEDHTNLQVSYHVAGFVPGGLKNWAPLVDRVITEQFQRLKKLVETGSAE